MKPHTMNMFAETNEDLPIISGMARTEVTVEPPQWSDDGMDGYYNGAAIHITTVALWTVGPTPITYRVEVEKGTHEYRREYADGLEVAQQRAIYIASLLK